MRSSLRSKEPKKEQNASNKRSRKISNRMAIVNDTTRQQAAKNRLDQLENDHQIQDPFQAASDDDEFALEEGNDKETSRSKKSRKQPPNKRRTRGQEQRAPKPFLQLLEEAKLDEIGPNYLTVAAGPPQIHVALKLCSVCGNIAGYTCVRCGSRFCSRRCNGIHNDTRCLKFMA